MPAFRTVVLGISGGIAAYKAAEIASRLTQTGFTVEVIMTEAATRFITPLTLRSLTGRSVVTDMFETPSQWHIGHVALADEAQVVLIAPATADTIARLAQGRADDMLSCTVLATRAPVILAPAMNVNMWQSPVTQENLSRLKARGFAVIEPTSGYLACGVKGEGRLADIDTIINKVEQVMGLTRDLAGKYIVVTAGGTREPVDPVRFIGNRSSGKMGYAMAETARDRGARVCLVSGPNSLGDLPGVEMVHVETAAEMKEAVAQKIDGAAVLVMAAAVADYRPRSAAPLKIKKDAADITLELVRTADILSEINGPFIKVGFAAESDHVLENACRKIKAKKLDLIVANDITAPQCGFGTETNRVTMLDCDGNTEELPLMSKREVAEKLWDKIISLGLR
jgi:phosphopantothenoylcysteine decarboxylase/phosphopantothenate--cysteine ligase